MSVKQPHATDKLVGSRVRTRRLLVGLSQEKLGTALGITFQQIQKYEKGTNRIGASRLQQISAALGVPVSYFFDGIDQDAEALKTEGVGDIASLDLRLAREISELQPDQRRAVSNIVAQITQANVSVSGAGAG